MDVAPSGEVSLTCGDPAFPGRSLTLAAVSIAAAVVGDGGHGCPTAGALIEMTAECSGTTPRNGQQHFDVLPAEPLVISFDEGSSCAADEIGHLEGRPGSSIPPVSVGLSASVSPEDSPVAWRMTLGKMEVDGGLFEIAMA